MMSATKFDNIVNIKIKIISSCNEFSEVMATFRLSLNLRLYVLVQCGQNIPYITVYTRHNSPPYYIPKYFKIYQTFLFFQNFNESSINLHIPPVLWKK